MTYVAAYCFGGRHHVELGLVAVTTYGVRDTVTFRLTCALYKPKTCLKPCYVFQT